MFAKKHTNAQQLDLLTTLEIINDIIWYGSNSFQSSTLYHETRFGSFWLPLGANDLALCFSLYLELIILHLPQLEFLSAPWRLKCSTRTWILFLIIRLPTCNLEHINTDTQISNLTWTEHPTRVQMLKMSIYTTSKTRFKHIPKSAFGSFYVKSSPNMS